MSESIVVSDSSPLIGLAVARKFHLLRQMFRRITVTRVVREEVLAASNAPGAIELSAAIDEGWVDVTTTLPVDEFADLGRGEASVLALAMDYGGRVLVLMDETQGRRRAKDLGIPVTGLIGTLLEAKRRGLIETVRPSLERIQNGGFWLSEGLLLHALQAAGETGASAPSRR